MRLPWDIRFRKAEWGRKNREKTRESNRLWRAGNLMKVRRQARNRMRRYRARIKRQAQG